MAIMFPRNYTLKEYTTGSYSSTTGAWTEGTQSTRTIKADCQPITGEQLQSLDIGRRELGKIKVFTDETLNIAKQGSNLNGDKIVFDDGKTYEIIHIQKYNVGVISHYEYIGEIRR